MNIHVISMVAVSHFEALWAQATALLYWFIKFKCWVMDPIRISICDSNTVWLFCIWALNCKSLTGSLTRYSSLLKDKNNSTSWNKFDRWADEILTFALTLQPQGPYSTVWHLLWFSFAQCVQYNTNFAKVGDLVPSEGMLELCDGESCRCSFQYGFYSAILVVLETRLWIFF